MQRFNAEFTKVLLYFCSISTIIRLVNKERSVITMMELNRIFADLEDLLYDAETSVSDR